MNKPLATVLSLSFLVSASAVACGGGKAPMTPTPPEWLDTAVTEQAMAVTPNSHLIGQMLKGTAYDEDELQQWQIPLEANKCYQFSGAGDQTVQELYINVWDPTGDRIAKQKNDSPRVMTAYCTKLAGLYKVEGKVTEGYGHFAIGIFTDGAGAPPPPPEPAAPAAADLGKIVDDMAKASAPDATRVGEHFSGSTDKTDWYVALETGKCYWFIGAGADSISELYLYLWDPKDKRITANKSENNRVTVGHCPTSSGMYHFQAKANSGDGKYKVGVFAKKK
jgi:hypothetical protein